MEGRGTDEAEAHPSSHNDGHGHDHDHDHGRHAHALSTPIISNTLATPLADPQHATSYFADAAADTPKAPQNVQAGFAAGSAESSAESGGPSVQHLARSRSPSLARSMASSTSSHSSVLRDAVYDVSSTSTHIDLGASARPTVHRDLSHASATSVESTDSTATVVPSYREQRSNTFDPGHLASPISHTLASRPQSTFNRGGHPLPLHTPGSILAQTSSRSRSQNASPSGSPGLFDPYAQVKSPSLHSSSDPKASLHWLQAKKEPYHPNRPIETTRATIDRDPMTGRKTINDYMIVEELGRGAHGKVKLGVCLNRGEYVAIKIVQRVDRKRHKRLGRIGGDDKAASKVKREVAILKKARHPNIVALLEVIDDPKRQKVYLVLERVQFGEIPWRTGGVRYIALVESRRYDRESKGIFNDPVAEAEDEAVLDLGRVNRAKEAREQLRAWKENNPANEAAWSIEMAGDIDEDSDVDTISRMGSSVDSHAAPDLQAVLSKASEVGRMHRAESFDLLATVTPLNALAVAAVAASEDNEVELRNALMGTMYGAFDDPMSPPEEPSEFLTPDPEPSATIADAKVDIVKLSQNLSGSNLLQRAGEILMEPIHPDYLYVPCMTFQAIRECFRDVLQGLTYLHFHGIIHRDIKPPNLLHSEDHKTKISDFGVSYLAKLKPEGDKKKSAKSKQDLNSGVEDESSAVEELSDDDPDVDEAKELAKTVGTAAFYAPELCITDQDSDHAPIGKGIDVWALGITLFCMIFGRVPFIDHEYAVMRRIASEEIYIPKRRLRPTEFRSDIGLPPSTKQNQNLRNYRAASAIEYEDLDEDLLVLLKALLERDPRKRVTCEQIRDFKWVTADLTEPQGWKDSGASNVESAGAKIEISGEDVEESLIPLSLFERFTKSVARAAESIGLSNASAASKSRKASQDGSVMSTASSSSSNVQHYDRGRRPSLKDSNILQALKASRDPLPFGLSMTPLRPLQEQTGPTAAPHDARTDKGTHTSILSPTGSYKTIVPKEKQQTASYFDAVKSGVPSEVSSPMPVQGGAAKKLLRTTRDDSASRSSLDSSSRSSTHKHADTADAHGAPSVALSTESASGHVNLPSALKDTIQPSSGQASPRGSRQSSVSSTPDFGARQTEFDDGRLGKASPLSGTATHTPPTLADIKRQTSVSRPGSRLSYESTEEEFARADSDLLRRQVAEALRAKEKQAALARKAQEQADCPPSPDDEDYRKRRSNKAPGSIDSIPPSLVPSLDAGVASPTSSVMPLMTPVSSEDPIKLDATPGTSDPSLPASADEVNPVNPFDMANLHTKKPIRQVAENTVIRSNPSSTVSRMFQDDDEGYQGDTAVDSDDSEDDLSDTDDDGGLQIAPRRPPQQTVARSSTQSSLDSGRHSYKSTRSSSINTMKKVPRPSRPGVGPGTFERAESPQTEQSGNNN